MTSCCDPRKATCPEKTLVGCSIGSMMIGNTMMIVGLATHADSQELNTPPLAMHGVSVGVAVPIAVPVVSP